MNQQPGYGPPYGQQPPRRGGGFPWGWILGGCGGCFLVVVIGFVVVGMMGVGLVKDISKSVGPVNQQTIQQNLGEVPLYPNGRLDATGTQAVLITMRTVEKIAQKPQGSIFKAIAVVETADSPEKVLKYYDKTLRANGWQPVQMQNKSTTAEQKAYRKSNDFVLVQAQNTTSQTQVTLMRGGPELLKQGVNPTGSSGSSGSND